MGCEWGIRSHCQKEGFCSQQYSWGSLPLTTTFQNSWYMIRKPARSADSGQGLKAIPFTLTSHLPLSKQLRARPTLLIQCPRSPGPSAFWQDTLPLSWKHQVKLVRSLTNYSLDPSNPQTLLSSPGQKVRLRSSPH